VAAHAVGDEEEVAAVAAVLFGFLGKVGLADPEGAGQFRNEEAVLVVLANHSGVGEPEAVDRDRRRRALQHVVFRMRNWLLVEHGCTFAVEEASRYLLSQLRIEA
jgi:hypothetical protein